MENLLETILKEKKSEELARLDAVNIVNSLFTDLFEREQNILSRRFGLKGGKGETLEKIGGLHKLTRERVRQIEAASIRKINKLQNLEDTLSTLKKVINDIIDEHGGAIRHNYLLNILTVACLELNDKVNIDDPNYESNREIYRNHFNFLISKLMSDDLELVNKSDTFNPFFKKKEQKVDHLEELANDLLQRVEGLKKSLSTEELLDLLKKLDSYNKHQSKIKKEYNSDLASVFKSKIFTDKAEIINNNKILYSLLQAIKNLEQNKYGEWGIADWGEIRPKTVNDKIYLVLKHSQEPLHFTKIAEKINEMKFDNKIANPATVHNELILDKRYVLFSRGTYGLLEWQK